MTMADPERDAKLSARALIFATACLMSIVLVLAVSLTVVVGVAADRGDDLNALQSELECRSVITTEFSLIEGEIIASVAEALVGISRGEDISDFEVRLTEQVAELRSTSEERTASLLECANG